MSVETAEQLDEWRASVLEGFTDERIVSVEWVDAHIWFFAHSYADLGQSGLELRGFTFREKDGDWLLVLKLLQEGIPQVAFVSSANPTRCIQKTRKLLRNGGLTLYEDKYA